MSSSKLLILGALLSVSLLISTTGVSDESAESRGRYLVEIGGCNDCHTAGYAMSNATIPESEWLAGDILGYRGPWGTTYPPNLRMYMQQLSEDDWVTVAKTLQTRPPMPWWALHAMSADDLRALYRFIRSLGPVDKEIPAYVPPGQMPAPPYVQWPAPPE